MWRNKCKILKLWNENNHKEKCSAVWRQEDTDISVLQLKKSSVLRADMLIPLSVSCTQATAANNWPHRKESPSGYSTHKFGNSIFSCLLFTKGINGSTHTTLILNRAYNSRFRCRITAEYAALWICKWVLDNLNSYQGQNCAPIDITLSNAITGMVSSTIWR